MVMNLSGVSKSIEQSFNCIEAGIDQIKDKDLPKIKESLSSLDSSSVGYGLRVKNLSNMLSKISQDASQLSSIKSSMSTHLTGFSADLKTINSDIKLIEMNLKFEDANLLGKTYLTAVRFVNDTFAQVIRSSHFFRRNERMLTTAGFVSLSFMAGYSLAKRV